MTSRRRHWWKRARWRRSPIIPVLGLLWLGIAVIVIVWHIVRYTGIAFYAVELQYAQFGQAFPVLTLVPLILLVSLPGLILLWIRLPAEKTKKRNSPPVVHQAVAAEHRLLRILTIAAGLLLSTAAVLFVLTLMEPDAEGPPQNLDARTASTPGEGHARLTGTVLYQRTATFEQDVLFMHRPIRFAPIISASDRPIRFFVEITPERLDALRRQGVRVSFDGIIKRNALPGPIEQLFRYAGLQVDTPHFALFASRTSVCMPLYVMMLNALIAAACLGLLAAFQRYRFHKVRSLARRADALEGAE